MPGAAIGCPGGGCCIPPPPGCGVKFGAMLAIIAVNRNVDNPRSWISTRSTAPYCIRSIGSMFRRARAASVAVDGTAVIVGAGNSGYLSRATALCPPKKASASVVSRSLVVNSNIMVVIRYFQCETEFELSYRGLSPSSRKATDARSCDPWSAARELERQDLRNAECRQSKQRTACTSQEDTNNPGRDPYRRQKGRAESPDKQSRAAAMRPDLASQRTSSAALGVRVEVLEKMDCAGGGSAGVAGEA
jgi:hypothetical protein